MLQNLHQQIRVCNKCELCDTRRLAVPGEGSHEATVMFIGEAPGHVNDELGRPFVGHGGRILDGILLDCNLSREQVYLTNVVKCWPPGNRKPSAKEIAACKNHLDEEINITQPSLIIALGQTAFFNLTGIKEKMIDIAGKVFWTKGRAVVPTYHPNAIRYVKGGKKRITDDILAGLDSCNNMSNI